MNFNDAVKELLKTKGIDIGLNTAEEFQADVHGERGIAGYYLKAKQEATLETAEECEQQRYFYRAMSYEEAKSWISAWSRYKTDDKDNNAIEELESVLKDKKSGIHFATGAEYAGKYITSKSAGEIILEFDSPKLVKRFEKIGVERKNESGDMSYGIGFQESIALKQENSITDKIKEKYEKYKDYYTVVKLREWWGLKEECSLEEKRKLLKVFYFLDVLESIRIVYVKNC